MIAARLANLTSSDGDTIVTINHIIQLSLQLLIVQQEGRNSVICYNGGLTFFTAFLQCSTYHSSTLISYHVTSSWLLGYPTDVR